MASIGGRRPPGRPGRAGPRPGEGHQVARPGPQAVGDIVLDLFPACCWRACHRPGTSRSWSCPPAPGRACLRSSPLFPCSPLPESTPGRIGMPMTLRPTYGKGLDIQPIQVYKITFDLVRVYSKLLTRNLRDKRMNWMSSLHGETQGSAPTPTQGNFTADKPLPPYRSPSRVTIPLQQHLGAPNSRR